MRDIDTVIIHCSDTPNNMDIGTATIREWHLERGWDDVGYHYIIRRDGTTEVGRQESRIGAHCLGKNYRSVGICLVGRDKFTKEQFHSLEQLVQDLRKRYDVIDVAGHHKYSNKTCPNFKVDKDLGKVDE